MSRHPLRPVFRAALQWSETVTTGQQYRFSFRRHGELSGSPGLSHSPGKDVCPPAHAFGRKSLCAKQSAALRCSQLATCGGAYARDKVVEWCAIFARLLDSSCPSHRHLRTLPIDCILVLRIALRKEISDRK